MSPPGATGLAGVPAPGLARLAAAAAADVDGKEAAAADADAPTEAEEGAAAPAAGARRLVEVDGPSLTKTIHAAHSMGLQVRPGPSQLSPH